MTNKQLERNRSFAILLKKNKAVLPNSYGLMFLAGFLFYFLAILFYFSAPIISFSNGTTVSKPVNFTSSQLSGYVSTASEISILIGSYIFFSGVLVLALTLARYRKFYLNKNYTAQLWIPDDKAIKKVNLKNKIGTIIGMVLVFVAIIPMINYCSVVTAINNRDLYRLNVNPYWTPHTGWGVYAIEICAICAFAFLLASFLGVFSIRYRYVNGTADEEDVLKFFKCAKSAGIPAPQTPSLTEKLSELNQLKEKGWITEEDYEQKKAQILELQNQDK